MGSTPEPLLFVQRTEVILLILSCVKVILESARDALSVPLDAAKLLWRYLPQLVTVICLALAARGAVLWFAVVVSAWSPLAATLIFPFAPLSVMTGVIICFWIMQPSMDFFGGETRFTKLDKATLLTVGGLLIPFLTVYSSHGLLRDDGRTFVYDSVTIEVANSFLDYDFDRSLIDSGWLFGGFILSILVLRKLIGALKLGERAFGVATAAAYLEVLWMATASLSIASNLEKIRSWIVTRKGIGPVWDGIVTAKDWVVDHTWIVGDVIGWLWSNAAQIGNFIVVPFAWLTLGAVVYNTSLTRDKDEKSALEEDAVPPEQTVADAPIEGPAEKGKLSPHDEQKMWAEYGRRYSEAAFRTTRDMLDNAAQPLVGPFRNAWRNFKTLTVAGAVPMLTFCLVFVLASCAELGVIYALRALIKPMALGIITVGLEPYVLVLARAVYFIVALPLVVAALDRFLSAEYSDEELRGNTEEQAVDSEAKAGAAAVGEVSAVPMEEK